MNKVCIIISVIIMSIIGYIVSSIAHELGHVICGLLNKWKLILLEVGPIKLYRENLDSKIKIGLEKM